MKYDRSFASAVDSLAARLHCDHIHHSGRGWLTCVRCGAVCSRDRDGVMERFERYPNQGVVA